MVIVSLTGYWQELWERLGGVYGISLGLLGFIGIAYCLINIWVGLDEYFVSKYGSRRVYKPNE